MMKSNRYLRPWPMPLSICTTRLLITSCLLLPNHTICSIWETSARLFRESISSINSIVILNWPFSGCGFMKVWGFSMIDLSTTQIASSSKSWFLTNWSKLCRAAWRSALIQSSTRPFLLISSTKARTGRFILRFSRSRGRNSRRSSRISLFNSTKNTNPQPWILLCSKLPSLTSAKSTESSNSAKDMVCLSVREVQAVTLLPNWPLSSLSITYAKSLFPKDLS